MAFPLAGKDLKPGHHGGVKSIRFMQKRDTSTITDPYPRNKRPDHSSLIGEVILMVFSSYLNITRARYGMEVLTSWDKKSL